MGKRQRESPIMDWLTAHGRSQRSLARELGISPAHLCNVLKGKRMPSFALAVRLAKMMRRPVERIGL